MAASHGHLFLIVTSFVLVHVCFRGLSFCECVWFLYVHKYVSLSQSCQFIQYIKETVNRLEMVHKCVFK